ncbi:MAG: GFA family protein [Rhodospirillales bacterium]|nr:GFA family protein [Rhodospirillales bacterium]MBN8906793.1 GFA family protein [Rhodospirillales bacterium]
MPATDRHPVLSGGCQCGAVRYALSAMPDKVGICHCRMCQKAVGGPFFAWAGLPAGDLTWTRGRPATFRSSSTAERGFCAACGTPLTFRYLTRPDAIDISLGSLDRPEAVTPTHVMGIESRLGWCAAVLPEAQGVETGAVDPPEDLATLVNRQHPDHDTGADWRPPA